MKFYKMHGKYIKITQSSIAIIRRPSITTQYFWYSLPDTSCCGLHGHHLIYNYKVLLRKLGAASRSTIELDLILTMKTRFFK